MPYVQQLLHKTQANMLITHAQPNMKIKAATPEKKGWLLYNQRDR